MSADAKAWKDGDAWAGLHDGPCLLSEAQHRQGDYYLTDLLHDLEACLGRELRWEFRTYPADGTVGLVGYVV